MKLVRKEVRIEVRGLIGVAKGTETDFEGSRGAFTYRSFVKSPVSVVTGPYSEGSQVITRKVWFEGVNGIGQNK